MFLPFSIKQKIQLLAFTIILCCTVAFTYYHYMSERSVIIRAIDNRLSTSAYALPYLLPEGYHDRIEGINSVSQEEQAKIQHILSDYAKKTNLLYIYSFMMFDGQVVFTSCNATPEELQTGYYTKFFDKYPSASERVIDAFHEETIQFVEEIDEFGYFRSVLIPFKTESGKTYVAGADIPMSFVKKRLRNLILRSITIGFFIFIVFSAIAYVIANRIATPIIKLTQSTQDVISHGFDFSKISSEELETIARCTKDETKTLALTFKSMQEELHRYIINLKETTAAKERIESELMIAHDIQMNLLPRAFPGAPKHPEIELHAILEPARQVGGDLYDTFELGDGRIFFSIGDVSDKGVPAALFMAVTKALFRAYGQEDIPLSEIVKIVNNELSRDNHSQMFVTIFCCIIDLETGTVEYCDGGHEDPFIISHTSAVQLVEKIGGTALGFIPDIDYESGIIQLEPGDTFFLYTDGVNEAMNPQRKQYSVDRIQANLREFADSPPEKITQNIIKTVHEHASTEPQSDDITVMAIRYLGKIGV